MKIPKKPKTIVSWSVTVKCSDISKNIGMVWNKQRILPVFNDHTNKVVYDWTISTNMNPL